MKIWASLFRATTMYPKTKVMGPKITVKFYVIYGKCTNNILIYAITCVVQRHYE